MGLTLGGVCTLYAHPYTSTCVLIEAHHVCPESWFLNAGLPVETPMIELCPNCHYNTHEAIDARIAKREFTFVPPRCQALADHAFTLAAAKGLTPTRTL